MSREQFETWWEINYHNGQPPRHGWEFWRDGDGYKIDDDESELDGMWNAWQAATNALEAKCAALAAENAALKSFGGKLAEMHNDLNGEGAGIQGRAEVACQQVALEAAMEEFDAIKTPDTDAFLAEVRASAVDEACLKISNAIVNCYQDEQIGLDAAATICGDFDAQLRREAAQ